MHQRVVPEKLQFPGVVEEHFTFGGVEAWVLDLRAGSGLRCAAPLILPKRPRDSLPGRLSPAGMYAGEEVLLVTEATPISRAEAALRYRVLLNFQQWAAPRWLARCSHNSFKVEQLVRPQSALLQKLRCQGMVR